MSFWETIELFFTEFSLLSAVMLLMGVALVLIEMFRSSRRMIGTAGAVLIAAGVVIRMLGGGTVMTLFLIVLFVSFVLLAVHLLVLRFQKRGWLYQSLHLAVEAQKRGVETGDYEFLVGLSGMAATDINADGNMSLGDVTFLVRSEQYIERGSRVRVTAVDGEKVFVAKEEKQNELSVDPDSANKQLLQRNNERLFQSKDHQIGTSIGKSRFKH